MNMYTKFFFLLFFSALIYVLYKHLTDKPLPLEIPKGVTFTPKNTIFVWDLHEVVLRKDMPEIIKTIWYAHDKLEILKNLRPSLLFDFIALAFNHGTGDEYVQAAKHNNNPKLASLIIEGANSQKPIQGTVEIIKQLYTLGYQNFVGSNIGTKMFANLLSSSRHTDIQHIFHTYFNLTAPQTVAYDAHHVIKKPSLAFYHQFLTKNHIDLNKTHVIFVDDKKENVIAARTVGFTAIHFISPQQLKNTLQTLGILNKPIKANIL